MNPDNEDIIRRLKTCRGEEIKWYGDLDSDYKEWIECVAKGFKEPSKDNPVSTAEFLHWLDIEPVMPIVNPWYSGEEWRIDYPKKAMVKAAFLMKIKKFSKITELQRHLANNPKDAELLEFKKLPNGKVMVPPYETLRYFINERMGRDGVHELMDALVRAIKEKKKELRLEFGKRVGEDASPVVGARNDNDCKYNAHYRIQGWKMDVVLELDDLLPLTNSCIGINEDEGKCLSSSKEKLNSLGIEPEQWWFDGKYATYENIALCNTDRIETHYPISVSWQYRKDTTIKEIKRQYHKLWKKPDYIPNANLDYILKFLVNHGKHELVGAFFRNDRLAEYEE
ncbi:MAG: hypothetical protein AB1485_09895, partial [Candidatus Thermoplasmatota archaeon]